MGTLSDPRGLKLYKNLQREGPDPVEGEVPPVRATVPRVGGGPAVRQSRHHRKSLELQLGRFGKTCEGIVQSYEKYSYKKSDDVVLI